MTSDESAKQLAVISCLICLHIASLLVCHQRVRGFDSKAGQTISGQEFWNIDQRLEFVDEHKLTCILQYSQTAYHSHN